MKKSLIRIGMILSVVCLMLGFAAAEDAPLKQLYDAEDALLFETPNVTMLGHAEFSVDGRVFKEADLKQIRNGTQGLREWKLKTPREDGSIRETGYTVVNKDQWVYSWESYQHGVLNNFLISPEMQRESILSHTVGWGTLRELGSWIFEVAGDVGEQSREKDDAGKTTLTLTLTEKDLSDGAQDLLNLVLRYGIKRYTRYDTENQLLRGGIEYDRFMTVAEGLIFETEKIRLKELRLTAREDEQGRLTDVMGNALFTLWEHNADHTHELGLDFSQQMKDYGSSTVEDDVTVYNNWFDPAFLPWVDETWDILPVEDAEYSETLNKARHYITEQKLITPEESESLIAEVNLLAANKSLLPFKEPRWVVRFYGEEDEVAEVWMNRDRSTCKFINVPVLREKAEKDLLEADLLFYGEPLTRSRISTFSTYVVYVEDADLWMFAFDTGTGTVWTLYYENNEELTFVGAEGSNG